jgi:hypothetical protein
MKEQYKLISVDTNGAYTNSIDPIKLLEERVNKFLNSTTDRFIPSGTPVYLDGDIVQTLINLDLAEQ